MKVAGFLFASSAVFVAVMVASLSGQGRNGDTRRDGQHLFERETFGGTAVHASRVTAAPRGLYPRRTRKNASRPILRIRFSSTTAATTGMATA